MTLINYYRIFTGCLTPNQQEATTIDIDSVASASDAEPADTAAAVRGGKPPVAPAATAPGQQAARSPATVALRKFVEQAQQDLNEVVGSSMR